MRVWSQTLGFVSPSVSLNVDTNVFHVVKMVGERLWFVPLLNLYLHHLSLVPKTHIFTFFFFLTRTARTHMWSRHRPNLTPPPLRLCQLIRQSLFNFRGPAAGSDFHTERLRFTPRFARGPSDRFSSDSGSGVYFNPSSLCVFTSCPPEGASHQNAASLLLVLLTGSCASEANWSPPMFQ